MSTRTQTATDPSTDADVDYTDSTADGDGDLDAARESTAAGAPLTFPTDNRIPITGHFDSESDDRFR
ncbi:MAG: hypothetical protein ABEJ31_09810 [Haloarculaceae archaeon]